MGRGKEGHPIRLGRYEVFEEVASGGMASVCLGRLSGPGGFSRTVAIKRLHPHLARDPEFSSQFLDEARLAAKVRHPNVISIIDVVELEDEVALVMDFILGESLAVLLAKLSAQGQRIPASIASGILVPILHGLHAAHETRDVQGLSLGLIHRDVSPQNILIGIDGIARVLDFGIAKAVSAVADQTQRGILKGKLGYLAPEQVRGAVLDRRVDIFAAGIVLWEMLSGTRLFRSASFEEAANKILQTVALPPSRWNAEPILDALVLQALAKKPEQRFSTAAEMAFELERRCPPASSRQLASWLEPIAKLRLDALRAKLSEVESTPSSTAKSETLSNEKPPEVSDARSVQTRPLSTKKNGRIALFLAIAAIATIVSLGLVAIGYAVFSAGHREGQATAPLPSSTPLSPEATGTVKETTPKCQPLDRITALSSGPAADFTCALRDDNSVLCWGDNQAAQLGDGSRRDAAQAVAVTQLAPAVEVAAGNRHACAVLGDTQVACWGRDLLTKPTRVLGLNDILHLRCGARHSCALRNDGIVSCWGENDRGQLGSPSLDAALTVVVESLGPVKYMASGSDHSCAIIAKDGSLWCWGDNAYGQLGQGKTDTQVHAQPIRVPGLPPCVQVEAGDKTTFVRTDDDRIFGWGFGIKRPVLIDVQGVKKVATGGKQNCALVDGGRVWCWGFNDFGQLGDQSSEDSAIPRLMTSLFKVNDLAVGNVHICALIEGEVWCWGSNEYGQLGQGSKDRSRHPEPHRVMTGGCP